MFYTFIISLPYYLFYGRYSIIVECFNKVRLKLWKKMKRVYLLLKEGVYLGGVLDSTTSNHITWSDCCIRGRTSQEDYCWTSEDFTAVGLNLLKESEIFAPQPEYILFSFYFSTVIVFSPTILRRFSFYAVEKMADIKLEVHSLYEMESKKKSICLAQAEKR